MNIVPLSRVRKEDWLLCGNKGSQLGELAFAGLPVPDGFIVTTEAYSNFMTESGLREQIHDALREVEPSLHPDLSSVAEEFKGWALQVHMDDELTHDLEVNFTELGVKYVAVRSSPIVVDDPRVLFSGRLATTMDVTKENLHENVERVWMSLYSTRGLEYLFSRNLIDKHILVAVVVQAVVDAEVSGVMYCGNFHTSDEKCLIVEAGWGLGETVVSGIVSPDRYVVNITKREVAESSIGKQMKEYVRAGENLRFVDIPEVRMNTRKLTNAQILELAAYYQTTMDHFGIPQKVEWGFSHGKFYILQTRPLSPEIE